MCQNSVTFFFIKKWINKIISVLLINAKFIKFAIDGEAIIRNIFSQWEYRRCIAELDSGSGDFPDYTVTNNYSLAGSFLGRLRCRVNKMF